MGKRQGSFDHDETLVLVLRRHAKALFLPFLVLVVVVALAVTAVVLVGEPWVRLGVAVVAAVVLLRWSVWPFLVWRAETYTITTRRLMLRSGVFGREGHDMPLARLNDVSFERSLWDRLLGCGTLVVESAGERGQLLLDDIPKVELVQRTLQRLSDELHGVDRGPDVVDVDLARTLDDEFGEEYRSPRTRPLRPE